MRANLLFLALATLAIPAAAQGNFVERRNPGVLWWEPLSHPITGLPYPDIRQNPPEHSAASIAGVPPGTLSYVWIPSAANDDDASQSIDGFRAPLGPSPATTNYPATVYFPKLSIQHSRKLGVLYGPDLSRMPYFTMPATTLIFAGYSASESTISLLTPYVLTGETEVVLSLEWAANDHRNKAGTLFMWGDAASPTSRVTPPLFGFVDPQGKISPQQVTGIDPGWLNLTYSRVEPVINAHSSFVAPTFAPKTIGYTMASYEAPLATGAVTLGWDVSAGSPNSGKSVIALLNVGPRTGMPTAFLGQSFGLDLTDPALGLFAGLGYFKSLDSFGQALGPYILIPPLGTGAIGTYLGVEYAMLNTAGTAIDNTTQAAWVRVR